MMDRKAFNTCGIVACCLILGIATSKLLLHLGTQDVRVVDVVEPVQDGVQEPTSHNLAASAPTAPCKCGAPACPCAGPLEPPLEPTPADGLHVNIVSEKDSYAPGETVELRAEGSAKGWAWWSASPHKVYEDAKVCVFSTAVPGDYVFVLAGFSDAHPVPLIAAHTVHIEGTPPAPTPPGPGPKPPEPAPQKQLSDLVREWTLKVNRPAEAAKLANVYDGVAWKINHGMSDPAEILKMTADGSRGALGVNVSFWKEWAESLRAELNARDAKAPLDYAATWRDIAGGLMATIPAAKATVKK